jgi:hypothetical protein
MRRDHVTDWPRLRTNTWLVRRWPDGPWRVNPILDDPTGTETNAGIARLRMYVPILLGGG